VIALELGKVAAEAEVAEATAGEFEQLVSRLGPRDAAAELRERAQRAPRRVGVRLLLCHFVAGSDAVSAEPLTCMSQGDINRRPSCGIRAM
jgi:hypothetical protein